MKKQLLYLVFATMLVTGCEKPHDVNQSGGTDVKVKSDAIISLQNDENADYSAVTVSSADANQLTVSKSLIEKSDQAANFKVGNIITAFTSPKEAVIGEILSIGEEGGAYQVKIKPETINALFENLDVDLSLDQLPDAAAGTKGESYVDAQHIVYPVRIIEQDKEGKEVVYSASDPATRASWNSNFEYPFAFSIPLSADKTSAISVKNGLIKSDLTAILNIKISWFSLKNFEASIQGYANAAAPVNVKFNVDQNVGFDKEFSTTISTDKYSAVYKIWGIPIVINFTPSVKFSGNLKANASADLNIDLGVNTDFKAGAYYSGSWKKEAWAKPSFKFDVSGVSSPILLQGKIGVVPGLELGLFGLIMGKAEVDSYATVDINAYVKTPGAAGNGELGVSLKSDGYVGGYFDLGLSAFGSSSIYRQDFRIFGPQQIANLNWVQPYSSIGK